MLWTDLIHLAIFLVVITICAITDLYKKKIYNYVTYPAVIVGFFLNGVFTTNPGLKRSMIGFLVGFGLFLIFYLFGGVGGGDVKLFALIGAFQGYPAILFCLFYTLLLAGGASLIYLIWQDKLVDFLKFMFASFLLLLSGVMDLPSETEGDVEQSRRIPLGVAAFFGCAWFLVERAAGRGMLEVFQGNLPVF